MTDPCPAPFNLAAYVLHHAARQPDKLALAIVTPDHAERWTYAQLETAVRGIAGGLLARGLTPGDRVLLRLGNTVDFPLAYLGAITAGLIPVPTSAQLTGPEITKMADQINPALVIAGAGVARPDHPAPVMDTDALEALFNAPPASYAMGDPNRPAYIIFTSGTGGTSRGVEHAHRAIWARRMMWRGWEGLGHDDRLMHAGAFNWTYTLGTGLLDPWACGATALIPGAGVTPEQLPHLMAAHGATIFAAAPGVYRQILKAPDLPSLPDLRHGLSAGEKLPPVLAGDWAARTGTAIYEALGMSECSTFISGSPDRPAQPGSSGFAQPGRTIAALDADANPLPPGQPGQLGVADTDPGLMLGYWNDPTATAQKRQNGWFLTGDMVTIDTGGAVHYLGRNDDLMNAGGFRVSPLEVEAALTPHPSITHCAAAEVEVKPGTRVIALFYTGIETDQATLMSFAEARLARYKQPRLYVWMDSLPMGGNGKINRRHLRENWKASP